MFGREFEVRYIVESPAVGDYVAHGRDLWIVSCAKIDDLGIVVTCDRESQQSPAVKL